MVHWNGIIILIWPEWIELIPFHPESTPDRVNWPHFIPTRMEGALHCDQIEHSNPPGLEWYSFDTLKKYGISDRNWLLVYFSMTGIVLFFSITDHIFLLALYTHCHKILGTVHYIYYVIMGGVKAHLMTMIMPSEKHKNDYILHEDFCITNFQSV